MKAKKRVFSGTRPSGRLHLGNYLGAVKGYIELQERPDFDCIYSVVDLHGVTTPYQPKAYQQQIREIVLDYLGAGLDPHKCHLMIQSSVPAHVELAYLLATVYPVSRVEQLPTYKEKKAQHPKYVNVGLLYYPILMAADILLYKADLVPAGKDQEPHLEVTREIARAFNRLFGKGKRILPEPRRFETATSLVPSLTGEGKMSKSVIGSAIFLTDTRSQIQAKLAKVPTDSGRGKRVPETGGVATLLSFAEDYLGVEKRAELEAQYLGAGIRYGELKQSLAAAMDVDLAPFREKRAYFAAHSGKVDAILAAGQAYCQQLAQSTLTEVKAAMGLA